MNKVESDYKSLRNFVDTSICHYDKFVNDKIKKSATDLRKDLMQIIKISKEMRKNISDAKTKIVKKPHGKPKITK